MAEQGKLAGKVAFITGGGSGIGAATARLFAAEGAQVVAADVSPRVLETFDDSDGITGIVLDVADSTAVRAAFAQLTEAHGKLDILLNGAGIAGVPPTEEELTSIPDRSAPPDIITGISDEAWDRVLAVNLSSQFYTLRSAVPLLKAAGGGSVINIASVAALISVTMPLHYPASKSGIFGLTRAAATELAPFNIRVNAVAPGSVDTPMLHIAGPEIVKELIKMQPLQRMASPEELARTMLFLGSDDGSYYTGQIFSPSGGLYM
jgi:3-oxoacyl-[acyl-carrier protein] reductase